MSGAGADRRTRRSRPPSGSARRSRRRCAAGDVRGARRATLGAGKTRFVAGLARALVPGRARAQPVVHAGERVRRARCRCSTSTSTGSTTARGRGPRPRGVRRARRARGGMGRAAARRTGSTEALRVAFDGRAGEDVRAFTASRRGGRGRELLAAWRALPEARVTGLAIESATEHVEVAVLARRRRRSRTCVEDVGHGHTRRLHAARARGARRSAASSRAALALGRRRPRPRLVHRRARRARHGAGASRSPRARSCSAPRRWRRSRTPRRRAARSWCRSSARVGATSTPASSAPTPRGRVTLARRAARGCAPRCSLDAVAEAHALLPDHARALRRAGRGRASASASRPRIPASHRARVPPRRALGARSGRGGALGARAGRRACRPRARGRAGLRAHRAGRGARAARGAAPRCRRVCATWRRPTCRRVAAIEREVFSDPWSESLLPRPAAPGPRRGRASPSAAGAMAGYAITVVHGAEADLENLATAPGQRRARRGARRCSRTPGASAARRGARAAGARGARVQRRGAGALPRARIPARRAAAGVLPAAGRGCAGDGASLRGPSAGPRLARPAEAPGRVVLAGVMGY